MDAAGPVLGCRAWPRRPQAAIAMAGIWLVGVFGGCTHSGPASAMARRPGAVATGRPNVVPRDSAEPTAWEREQVRQTAVRERREREACERRAARHIRRVEREARQAERQRRTAEKQLARELAQAQAAAKRHADAARARREAQERRLKLAAENREARRARGGAARVDAPDPLVVPTGSGSAPGWAQPMPY